MSGDRDPETHANDGRVGERVAVTDRENGNCVDAGAETVFTQDMTSTNFSDTHSTTYETVYGGPCDHCSGEAVAFFTVNFADGGTVGGYLCRNHLNEYEVAYGLPVSHELQVAA